MTEKRNKPKLTSLVQAKVPNMWPETLKISKRISLLKIFYNSKHPSKSSKMKSMNIKMNWRNLRKKIILIDWIHLWDLALGSLGKINQEFEKHLNKSIIKIIQTLLIFTSIANLQIDTRHLNNRRIHRLQLYGQAQSKMKSENLISIIRILTIKILTTKNHNRKEKMIRIFTKKKLKYGTRINLLQAATLIMTKNN